MTLQQWVIVGCAAVALAVGLTLALAGTPRPAVPRPRSRMVLAWLVVALGPVFLIFLFFPDSSVEGTFSWGKAGGAIAAFLVIWLVGVRHAIRADDLEQREGAVLRGERGPHAIGPDGAEPLGGGDVEFFDLVDRPKRSLALVPGGLGRLTFADVWISSENTNMQMARFFDRSVSGAIRYLGARRNAAEEVEQDVVGEALADRMEGRTTVPLGTVFDTDPGELARTHGVKRLMHVAAVWGELERGYAPAADIGGCARKALASAEEFARSSGNVRSVMLPLLGAGTARGRPDAVIPTVLDAAVDHLERGKDCCIRTVYVTAYTTAEMALCREKLDADQRLRPARRVKPGSLRASQLPGGSEAVHPTSRAGSSTPERA